MKEKVQEEKEGRKSVDKAKESRERTDDKEENKQSWAIFSFFNF